jgi:hypothetical protein
MSKSARDVLRVLRRLDSELGEFAKYGQLDLALQRACEGDLELVGAVKVALAEQESGQTCVQLVRDALGELRRRGNAGP